MKKIISGIGFFLSALVIGNGIVSYCEVSGLKERIQDLETESDWIGKQVSAVPFNQNKKYVFESQNDIKKELSSFVLLRFLTLIVENGCLYIFITLMHIQPMFSKLLVSFVTILSNYVLCKFKIFKKEGVYNG